MSKQTYSKDELRKMASEAGVKSLENYRKILTLNNQIFGATKSMANLDWVDANESAIVDWIEAKPNMNTRRSYYITLTAYYRDVKKLPAKKAMYSNLVRKLYDESIGVVCENKLGANELYRPYEDIVAIRGELEIAYEADPTNKQANMMYLWFSLMTLQPPLRTEYLTMAVEPKLNKKITTRDYVYRTRDGRWHVRIETIIKKQKKLHYTNTLSQQLSRIITQSLLNFPRQYLLSSWDVRDTNSGDKPLPYKTLSPQLSAYNLGVSAFRKAYVSWHRRTNPNASYNQKLALADLMRHDPSTAEIYYNKIVDNDALDEQVERKTSELKRQVEERKQPPPPPPVQPHHPHQKSAAQFRNTTTTIRHTAP